MGRVILYSTVGFILVVASIVLIERYVFSLVGAVLMVPRLCSEKTVTVGVDNDGARELSFHIDKSALRAEMRKNPLYKVGTASLRISRKFGDVEYGVVVEGNDGSATYFKIDTYDSESFAHRREGVPGESCTTPNHVLTDNIKTIIDDLPLTAAQKDEMKSHVHAQMMNNLPIFPIM